jgi:hypothetical protein
MKIFQTSNLPAIAGIVEGERGMPEIGEDLVAQVSQLVDCV